MTEGDFGWRDAALVGVLVVVVQAGVYAGVAWMIPAEAARGQFGDTFGVTNSLFSGLAVAGLIFTLILQQVQIQAQRDESKRIREEATLALAVQAQSNNLNALTFLMRYYEDRLIQLASYSPAGPSGADLLRKRDAYSAKRKELERIIAGLHQTVVSGLGDQHVR